jgi:hypothetical protein
MTFHPGSSRIGHGATVAFGTMLLVLVGGVAYGQLPKTAPHPLPSELRNQCAMCHTCTTPTKSDPCLITCPRVKESTGMYTPADGPGVMMMDKMQGQYGPVVFNHRAHAQMAEMSGGCYGCHHYNDTALRIITCKTCHPAERKRENVSLPDLKGAYHRQCLNCHRQWNGSPDCSTCHLEKVEGKTQAQILDGYTRGRKDHPPVPAPEKKVYVTKGQAGTVVTFFHTDHAKRFGLECVACHRNEGCIGCHDKRSPELRKREPESGPKDFDAHHARCSACHAKETCVTCHAAKEQEPFDHARSSGWALRPYHARLACAKCHGDTGTFPGLKRECLSCHTTFESGKFNHAVTGLKLDDTHSAVDCIECHTNKAFGAAPTCAGCHPDKTYPAFKPGRVAGK